jgi:hypothetical protein
LASGILRSHATGQASPPLVFFFHQRFWPRTRWPSTAPFERARIPRQSVKIRVVVSGAGSSIVNGVYLLRDAAFVPSSFALVCRQSGWDDAATWSRLNGARAWWEAPNLSYIYYNRGDNQWWLDSGATGLGLYVSRAAGVGAAPPFEGWSALSDGALPLPIVMTEDSNEL